MANDNKKSSPISSLNSIGSKKAARNVSPHSSYTQELRRSVVEANSPTIVGNGPYRGIVLRRIEYDKDTIPLGTWLETHYNNLASLTEKNELPHPLVSYKVYVPELHSMLPRVKILSGSTVACSEHSLIDLYPDFVQLEMENEPRALPGEVVIVDFGDKTNFEDGRFIKKVFSKTVPSPGKEGCADAMEVLLEACGLPPVQQHGGQWIGSDGLQERLIALSTLERDNLIKLAMLGRVGTDNKIREILYDSIPDHHGEAFKKNVDSLKPWPLRGPSSSTKGPTLLDFEQMEDAWMIPWYKDDNEYPSGYLNSLTTKVQRIGLENQQKLLQAAVEELNQLGDGAWESTRKAKIDKVKYHQDAVTKLRQSLRFDITVADKGRIIYDAFVSTSDVYTPKQQKDKQLKGLVFGVRLNLDKPPAETLEMRKLMILYYKREQQVLIAARNAINRLLKAASAKAKAQEAKDKAQTELEKGLSEKDREDIAAEKARIERFKALCPEGDNFSSTSYATGYAGDPKDAPYMKKALVQFDKLRSNGRRSTKKNMKDHPKRGYLVRSDVRSKIVSVIDIVNNLGGVFGLVGSPSRNLENNPQRGEKGKSATSYHYIFKAFDMSSGPSTLNQGFKFNGKYDAEMIKANSEYVITKDGKYLQVWAKSSQPPGFSYGGFSTQHMTLNALVCSGKAGDNPGPAPTVKIEGTYINLTRILLKHGFKRSTPVKGWWKQCGKKEGSTYRPRAEWWHWQLPEPEGTTWEAALLSVFPEDDIKNTKTYKHKNFVANAKSGMFRKAKEKKV